MVFGVTPSSLRLGTSQGQIRLCLHGAAVICQRGLFSARLAFRGKRWEGEKGTTVKNKSTVFDPYLTPLTPHKTQHTSELKSHSCQILCYKPGEHIKMKASKVVKKKKTDTKCRTVFFWKAARCKHTLASKTYKLYANDKHKMHRAASQTTLTDRSGDECNDGGWCGRSRSKD